MRPFIQINRRKIGPDHPVYVVAELSANHHQNFETALQMVRAAKDCGADAVKLQTYTPDTMTINSDRSCFRIQSGSPWDNRTLYDLYKDAYTPWEWQPKLKKAADELGLDLFSSAFDRTSVDFLEGMNVPAYKVASFELVDIPLIRYMVGKGKPVIFSSGMSTLEEIQDAISSAREAGATDLAVLKCTSAYPALPEEMNLATIPDLENRLGIPVGLSDHTIGTVAAIGAVTLGACIVEKHFILSRSDPTPDSAFSMEPAEFREMVRHIRLAEQIRGHVSYQPLPREEGMRALRRSLFVVKEMKKGDVFSMENIACIRPADGLAPRLLPEILGKKAGQDLPRGTPLSWKHVRSGD